MISAPARSTTLFSGSLRVDEQRIFVEGEPAGHGEGRNLDVDSPDNLLLMHAAQPIDGGVNENAKEFVSRTN